MSKVPIYITVQDVSRELEIPENTVRNHVARGFLKAERIGRQFLIASEDMHEYARMREERGDARQKFRGTQTS